MLTSEATATDWPRVEHIGQTIVNNQFACN